MAAGSVGTVETAFLDLPNAARARLRANAASDPRRLRDVRNTVAGARQRDSRLPRPQRRCARRRVCENAAVGKHQGRIRRGRSRRLSWPRPWLVGRHDWSRQGIRHRTVFRRQHESSRGMPGNDGAVVHESRDGKALWIRLSRDHGRRHGANRARVPRRARASSGSQRSPADRSAACRRSSGRFCIPIRSTRSS